MEHLDVRSCNTEAEQPSETNAVVGGEYDGQTASPVAASQGCSDCCECNERGVCGVCGLLPVVPRLSGATHVTAQSFAMQTLLQRTARFAKSDAPVAVMGETGSGKEVIARLLHLNSSRASLPFIAVNVAALPSELLESELFGHGKGAFTGADSARRGLFEAADGGTLFLDEIGEMPPLLQVKLLRVLQDGELRRVGENEAFSVDVRVVSATHRDLAQRVADGLFREDLYYRLKVLTLKVPPLREREQDILPLAKDLLLKEQAQATAFSPRANARLKAYAWPGNVRELENVVKHGAALATGPRVEEADLPDELGCKRSAPCPRLQSPGAASGSCEAQGSPSAGPEPRVGSESGTEPTQAGLGPAAQSLDAVERAHILKVLDLCKGSQTEAAHILGIARNTLWRKLRSYQASA